MTHLTHEEKQERFRHTTGFILLGLGLAYKVIIEILAQKYKIEYQADLVIKNFNIYIYFVLIIAGLLLLVGETFMKVYKTIKKDK